MKVQLNAQTKSKIERCSNHLLKIMIETVEAIIDEQGKISLLEAVEINEPRRAIVSILEEPPAVKVPETALLSEAALADWNRPEEDEAWSYLQPGQ